MLCLMTVVVDPANSFFFQFSREKPVALGQRDTSRMGYIPHRAFVFNMLNDIADVRFKIYQSSPLFLFYLNDGPIDSMVRSMDYIQQIFP